MVNGPQSEYSNLVSYFKHLVWLSLGFMSLVVAVVGTMFYTNLKDIRADAKVEATRVATQEAKDSVRNAFDDKNINAMILEAAKQKVGTVSDKMIEQQLWSKLQPLQKRMLMIGEISEYQNRMRLGFRSGLDQLNSLIGSTTDPDTLRFAKNTLAITAQDYQSSWLESRPPKLPGQTWLDVMKGRNVLPPLKQNLAGVVELANTDKDLNIVALSFIVFREQTGEQVGMFDFPAMKNWCARNEPKCK